MNPALAIAVSAALFLGGVWVLRSPLAAPRRRGLPRTRRHKVWEAVGWTGLTLGVLGLGLSFAALLNRPGALPASRLGL